MIPGVVQIRRKAFQILWFTYLFMMMNIARFGAHGAVQCDFANTTLAVNTTLDPSCSSATFTNVTLGTYVTLQIPLLQLVQNSLSGNVTIAFTRCTLRQNAWLSLNWSTAGDSSPFAASTQTMVLIRDVVGAGGGILLSGATTEQVLVNISNASLAASAVGPFQGPVTSVGQLVSVVVMTNFTLQNRSLLLVVGSQLTANTLGAAVAVSLIRCYGDFFIRNGSSFVLSELVLEAVTSAGVDGVVMSAANKLVIDNYSSLRWLNSTMYGTWLFVVTETLTLSTAGLWYLGGSVCNCTGANPLLFISTILWNSSALLIVSFRNLASVNTLGVAFTSLAVDGNSTLLISDVDIVAKWGVFFNVVTVSQGSCIAINASSLVATLGAICGVVIAILSGSMIEFANNMVSSAQYNPLRFGQQALTVSGRSAITISNTACLFKQQNVQTFFFNTIAVTSGSHFSLDSCSRGELRFNDTILVSGESLFVVKNMVSPTTMQTMAEFDNTINVLDGSIFSIADFHVSSPPVSIVCLFKQAVFVRNSSSLTIANVTILNGTSHSFLFLTDVFVTGGSIFTFSNVTAVSTAGIGFYVWRLTVANSSSAILSAVSVQSFAISQVLYITSSSLLTLSNVTLLSTLLPDQYSTMTIPILIVQNHSAFVVASNSEIFGDIFLGRVNISRSSRVSFEDSMLKMNVSGFMVGTLFCVNNASFTLVRCSFDSMNARNASVAALITLQALQFQASTLINLSSLIVDGVTIGYDSGMTRIGIAFPTSLLVLNSSQVLLRNILLNCSAPLVTRANIDVQRDSHILVLNGTFTGAISGISWDGNISLTDFSEWRIENMQLSVASGNLLAFRGRLTIADNSTLLMCRDCIGQAFQNSAVYVRNLVNLSRQSMLVLSNSRFVCSFSWGFYFDSAIVTLGSTLLFENLQVGVWNQFALGIGFGISASFGSSVIIANCVFSTVQGSVFVLGPLSISNESLWNVTNTTIASFSPGWDGVQIAGSTSFPFALLVCGNSLFVVQSSTIACYARCRGIALYKPALVLDQSHIHISGGTAFSGSGGSAVFFNSSVAIDNESSLVLDAAKMVGSTGMQWLGFQADLSVLNGSRLSFSNIFSSDNACLNLPSFGIGGDTIVQDGSMISFVNATFYCLGDTGCFHFAGAFFLANTSTLHFEMLIGSSSSGNFVQFSSFVSIESSSILSVRNNKGLTTTSFVMLGSWTSISKNSMLLIDRNDIQLMSFGSAFRSNVILLRGGSSVQVLRNNCSVYVGGTFWNDSYPIAFIDLDSADKSKNNFSAFCNRLNKRLVLASSFPVGSAVARCIPLDSFSVSVAMSSDSSSSSWSRSMTISSTRDLSSRSYTFTASLTNTFSHASRTKSRAATSSSSASATLIPGPEKRHIVPQSTILAAVTSLVTAAVLPSTAMAVQRSVLLENLAQCEFSFSDPLDRASSPTQMLIGVEDNGYLRGAVVGNWLIWLGFATLGYGFRFTRSRMTGRTFADCTDAVYLPGLLIVPFVFLLQPTVSASVALVLHANDASDGALGAVSSVLIAAICAGMGLVLSVWFRSVKLPVEDDDESGVTRARWQRLVIAGLKFVFSDEREWTDTTSPRFTARFGKMYEPCRGGMHGFAYYEVVNSVVAGVLGGVMPGDDAGCYGLLVALCVLAAMYVVAVLVCRPYGSRVDKLVAAFGGVCTLLIAIMALLGNDASGAGTMTVLLYGSLFSVLMFVVQVIVLTRLHHRISSLLQGVAVLFLANRSWYRPGNGVGPGGKDDGVDVPLTAAATDHAKDECQGPILITPFAADDGEDSYVGIGLASGVSKRTLRRRELLESLRAVLESVTESQRSASPRSAEHVQAALSVLVDCACLRGELFE